MPLLRFSLLSFLVEGMLQVFQAGEQSDACGEMASVAGFDNVVIGTGFETGNFIWKR